MASTRPWLAQGLQVLVIGLVVVDSMGVTVLLPRVAADFDSSRDAAIWVVNLYQMVVLGLLLPLAALGQQIGFKRIYLGGLLVLGGGALLSAAAPTLPLLVLARVVQGIGAAGVMAVNTALLRASLPASQLARALATLSTATALSMTLAPTLAAVVLAWGSWRWLYLCTALLALAGAGAAWRLLPPARHTSAARIDRTDALLNLLVFGLFLLALRLMPAGLAWGLLAAALLLGSPRFQCNK